VDGDRVYVESHYGDVVCFETADGKEVWRKNLLKDFNGEQITWAFSESPLVDGDKVIVTPGGRGGTVVALNKRTGETVWRTKDWTDAPAYTGAIVAEVGGIRQYIQTSERTLAGIAADSGKVLWKTPRKGRTAVIPSPIYHDGYVYVTTGYGQGCQLFKITEAGGTFSAKLVYGNTVMVNHHGGVVLVDGKVYGHSEQGGWTCQDFKTGEADWQEPRKFGKGSVIYADGHLYLRQEGGPGTIALVEATPKGYTEVSRFNPPDRSRNQAWPHPAIANGKLYIRDQDVLLCYDIKAK
jgi:outer membrane protein assembly factor BamB